MPIFEYVCPECGHELEALQKVGAQPLKECPKCHKDALTKKLSAPPFHLKGTGWYATDFKDKGKKPKAEVTEGSKDKKSESSSKDSSSKSTEKE